MTQEKCSEVVKDAIIDLYGTLPDNRDLILVFNGRFKGYNANVHYNSKYVEFRLSKAWKEHSTSLIQGLIQSLAIKVYNTSYQRTLQIDLYNNFINNLPKYTKIDEYDEELSASFNRVNNKYFDDLMDKVNLKWGSRAYRKLGHYEYTTNTVVISEIFKGEELLLDYIMFHELLHKKHGLKKTKNGRNIHHSKDFRKDEKRFEDKNIEKKLNWFVQKKKFKSLFGF